jgi:hypothetical protein
MNFSFTSDSGPARWTLSAALREQVETAKASPKIVGLLRSKLYTKLSEAEWVSVLKYGSPDWEEE